jgi:hypothetical protein
MTMEPSESALRVLSTMFDAEDNDREERLGPAHTISASRPAEDCGCHNERTMRPLGKTAQFSGVRFHPETGKPILVGTYDFRGE